MFIVDLTSNYILLLLGGVFLKQVWNSYIAWREKQYILDREDDAYLYLCNLHPAMKTAYTEDNLEKALRYERTQNAFGIFENRINGKTMLLSLLFGIVPLTMNFFMTYFSMSFVYALICTFISLSFLNNVFDLPFSLYKTFKIETKFGFNNTSIKLFFTDFFKNNAISFIYGSLYFVGVVFLLNFIHSHYGKIDWKICILISIFMSLVSFVMEIVEIKIIVPMFNKLSPMEDSELKKKMEKLMNDFGFNSKGVYVIDASRRSSHSNAYCSGWGKNKQLVLFDTMLKSMSDDEILAILGHELAHSKLNHLTISRIIEFVTYSIELIITAQFIYDVNLYHAFGFSFVNESNLMVFSIFGFWLFGEIYSSYDWILDGFENWISRKMEYSADSHSCQYNGSKVEPMISSLIKLYSENLSYPLNDPLYEAWFFSHPGFVNRINALKSKRFYNDCTCDNENYNDYGRTMM